MCVRVFVGKYRFYVVMSHTCPDSDSSCGGAPHFVGVCPPKHGQVSVRRSVCTCACMKMMLCLSMSVCKDHHFPMKRSVSVNVRVNVSKCKC